MLRILTFVLTGVLLSSASFAMTMEEAVQKALKNNFELLASKHRTESRRYDVKTAETPYMPKLDAEYSYQNSSEKAYGNVEDQYSRFALTLGYNLFNGFSDKLTIDAAKSTFKAEQHNTEAVRQDITLSVKRAYINVLSAIDDIIVTENAVQLLENQLKDITLSYEVGYVAKNEVLKVEAELASSRQDVLSAKSGLRTAVFSLEDLIGEDVTESENFQPEADFEKAMESTDVLKGKMLEKRSELKYLQELIYAQNYSIKSVKGGYYPKVDVGASYYSYGEDISPADRDYTYDSETVLSVKVSVNLFDGFDKRSRTRSMQAEKLYMINMLRDTKSSMVLQLKNAVENFDLAKASQKVAEKELLSAKENYRITQSQFKQKVATNTDLMDARVLLTRAENSYNTAKFNIQRAVADIERVIENDL